MTDNPSSKKKKKIVQFSLTIFFFKYLYCTIPFGVYRADEKERKKKKKEWNWFLWEKREDLHTSIFEIPIVNEKMRCGCPKILHVDLLESISGWQPKILFIRRSYPNGNVLTKWDLFAGLEYCSRSLFFFFF